MTYIKIQKTAAYFSRFQPKFRRRREGKTNYRVRRTLVRQAKDKYGATKMRLVVRRTCSRIICQLVVATIVGDRTIVRADSTELSNYGITFGLTNYAAAYATGLLMARRVLKHYGIDNLFPGVESVDGLEYHPEESSERRPIKAFLDIGISVATKGNRAFGAMKGVVDGGVNVPHGLKRFPGYDDEKKTFSPDELRKRIFGKHVSEYMIKLEKDDPERYNILFRRYIKMNIKPQDMEKIYQNAHIKIRKNPDAIKKEVKSVTLIRRGYRIETASGMCVKRLKISKEERKKRIAEKLKLVAEMSNA